MDCLIMEWLILVLLTPLVVVAVVLLYGFVGCGEVLGIEDRRLDLRPTNLKATAVGTERIELTWDSPSPADTKEFSLERRKLSETTGWAPLADLPTRPNPVPAKPGVAPSSIDPVGEGAAFAYRVEAVAKDDGERSGFRDEASAKTLLKAPSGFVATRVDATLIYLKWINNSTKAKSIKLDRSLTPGSGFQPYKSLGADATSFPDGGLTAGTNYYYRLTALGGEDTASVPVEASEATLAWKTSFEAAIDLDGGGYYAGSCLVQRIPAGVPGNPATLQEGGSWVRITMFSDAPQETKITTVYISRVGTPKPYDSAADIQQVLFGGAPGVTLSQNRGPQVSDATKYTLDRGQALIIAFDTSIDSQNIYYGNAQGPQLYARRPQVPGAAFTEAKGPTRSVGYLGPEVNRVNCVQKIEVA
jgi:hypothetical protein